MPEQITRLIAIRHGETPWNAVGRLQGHQDIPLNELGMAQARRVAHALREEGIEQLYSSDLLRARQTAEAVSSVLGLPVHIESGLRERGFGVFEGLSFAELERDHPEHALRWKRREPGYRPEGGESLQDLQERVLAALTGIAQAHPGQHVAVVAHGGVLDMVYRIAARLPIDAPRTWTLANAAINRLLYTPQGFRVVGWAEDLHLDGAADDASVGSIT